MSALELPERDDHDLSSLLRSCRGRIPGEVTALGSFHRHPLRVGRRVTQEEAAEAACISRQWYAMMETGRAARISTGVLARLADVLMMNAQEREALLCSALRDWGFNVFDGGRSQVSA